MTNASSSGAGVTAVGDQPARSAEQLLQEAEAALAAMDAAAPLPPGVNRFSLNELKPGDGELVTAPLDLLNDVELEVRVELGRSYMLLEDVLKLRRGSVVALDKLAGDPVDVYVNGRLIARGEVMVMNDNFCVRVTELVSAD